MSQTIAVIFTSELKQSASGYQAMAEKMEQEARKQQGFISIESVRDGNKGITISYWQDMEAVKKWRQHAEHQLAQKLGKDKWYSQYQVKVCQIQREYQYQSPEFRGENS